MKSSGGAGARQRETAGGSTSRGGGRRIWPSPSTRTYWPKSGELRAQVPERRDRRQRIVDGKRRRDFATAQIRREEVAGRQFARPQHLQADPGVLGEVDPGDLVCQRLRPRRRACREVVVG